MARLEGGRRKASLEEMVFAIIATDFAGRVLPFDVFAADHYAVIVSGRDRAGRPISSQDAQIAAICRRHGATIATRDATGFLDTGIDVIDPWTAA